MEISLLTWNTGLYRYGEDVEKKYEDAPTDEIINYINKFMEKEKNSNSNPVVVLQEIPYKKKLEKKWVYNKHFETIKERLSSYKVFWLNDKKEWHIMMTAIIAFPNFLSDYPDVIKSNRFVPVLIKETQVSILGVHAQGAFQLNEWIKDKEDYRPNIIIGDFNAGNYIKSKDDYKIAINRKNFQMLSEGYIDACQGKYTFKPEKGGEKTQIDHVLIENSWGFGRKCKLKDVTVDDNNQLSDHYPVRCSITID